MKKYFYLLLMMVMSSALVTSCLSDNDSDSNQNTEERTITSGLFVINNGMWHENNGSLTYFDYETLKSQQYLTSNPDKKEPGLGDTPNDAYVKGDTIFIVGSTDNVIFVVNKKDFSIMKTISTIEGMGEEAGYTPRHITGYGNNIYFTTYGGYVGIIDTKTLTISPLKYQVGSAPEGLTLGGTSSDPILFVANSDYGNGNASISKIHLNSGVSDAPITDELINNPMEIVAIGDEFYFIDYGHYDEQWNQLDAGLYRYQNGKVTKVIEDATGMGVGLVYYNNQVVGYRLVTYNAPFGSTAKPTYSAYNTFTGEKTQLTLSGDTGKEIFSPAAIAIDPLRGSIIIASRSEDPDNPGSYSSTLPGYANIYSSDGRYVEGTHFQTGVEPHMIGFLFDTKTIVY